MRDSAFRLHFFPFLRCVFLRVSYHLPFSPSSCRSARIEHSLKMADFRAGLQTLRFAKLSPRAVTPSRGSDDAAGFDLYSAEDIVVQPGDRAVVKTDIQVEIPAGCYGRVAPRSGLAVRFGIDVGAGVIDRDYRGNVAVLLFNFGAAAFAVSCGDRIAQLVVERVADVRLEELPSLSATQRGSSGFGSTGI